MPTQNSYQPYIDLFTQRRSIRVFKDEPVSEAVLQKIIEVGCLSPSAHHAQPWRFLILPTQQQRVRVAEVMSRHMERVRSEEGESQDVIRKRTLRTIQRFTGAPAAILVCCEYPETALVERGANPAERTLMIQSVASAIGYILLAVQAEGLGACWVGYPAFCPAELFFEFGMPSAWEPQAAILLGHPAEIPPAPIRRPLTDLVKIAEDKRA
jgi:coenzyme F420-0:L-glutamate ligase / coenzyme F420-1:gamma-L-glutamate ligase